MGGILGFYGALFTNPRSCRRGCWGDSQTHKRQANRGLSFPLHRFTIKFRIVFLVSYHPTAGKDRTGVISAILLKVRISWSQACISLIFHIQLAGADDEAIEKDYALTRVGRERNRQTIMARLSKEPIFASNNEAALNMFTCRYVLNNK